jgi:hypothetical protein
VALQSQYPVFPHPSNIPACHAVALAKAGEVIDLELLMIKMITLFGFLITAHLTLFAETKLTPLKTGGNTKPIESLKAKKEPKDAVKTPAPAKMEKPVAEPFFSGPKSGWGVVSKSSPFFTEEGENIGKVPAGALFTYSGVKHATGCFVLIAKIKGKSGKWEGPFLIQSPDVVFFSGELTDMSEQLIANIQNYYTLLGKIEARKEELELENQSKNPHFESAKLWQKRYADSITAAAELEEKSNTLKGGAKSKAVDELRTLKYEQSRVKIMADKEAASYKAWKEQNPTPPAVINADPTLQDLQKQLKAAKEKVKDVVVE